MILIFLVLVISGADYGLYGQCCSAGNPSSTNSMTAGGKDVLSFSFSQMLSYSDTYYTGASIYEKEEGKSALDNIKESSFDFSFLSMSYGITDDLKLSLGVGYFSSKYQKYDYGDIRGVRERDVTGFGDLSVNVAYNTYSDKDNLFNIQQTFKLTFPTGEFDVSNNGIIYPIDIQPSSGNNKYDFGLIFSKSFESIPDFSIMSINNFEISQLIDTEKTHYKYGNQYNLSLMGIYKIFDELTGILELKANIREQAMTGFENEDNIVKFNFMDGTGGSVVFISPKIKYDFLESYSFSLQFDMPVYKNMNGTQLTNAYSLRAGISAAIDFSDEFDEGLIDDDFSDISLVNAEVNGVCEMCQKRIVRVTKSFSDVLDASWNIEKKLLTISYKEKRPDIDKILKAIADAGHDNEKYKATDQAYEELNPCCHYDR